MMACQSRNASQQTSPGAALRLCLLLDVWAKKSWLGSGWGVIVGPKHAETKPYRTSSFSVTTTRREFRSEHDLSIICPRSWVGQVEVDSIESQIKWTRSAQVAEVQSNIPGIATLKCPRFGILPHFAALSQCLKSFLAGVLAYHAKTCSWIKDFPTALT